MVFFATHVDKVSVGQSFLSPPPPIFYCTIVFFFRHQQTDSGNLPPALEEVKAISGYFNLVSREYKDNKGKIR